MVIRNVLYSGPTMPLMKPTITDTIMTASSAAIAAFKLVILDRMSDLFGQVPPADDLVLEDFFDFELDLPLDVDAVAVDSQ